MTRNSIRFLSTGLAAVALMGATQLPQIARAAPTAPVADSTATDATLSSLAMSASSGATVTVGGVQMRILATLPVTQKAFTMAAITWSSSTGSPTLQMRARGACAGAAHVRHGLPAQTHQLGLQRCHLLPVRQLQRIQVALQLTKAARHGGVLNRDVGHRIGRSVGRDASQQRAHG